MEAEQQKSKKISADYDLFGDLDYADGTNPFK